MSSRWPWVWLPTKIAAWLRYRYDVPWCVPAWGWKELRATAACLVTGRIVRGPHPKRFAEAVSSFLGVQYAIPVNRGRTAIELGIRAIGIGPGDEVVVPSFLCRSVLDSVQRAGAVPVFADIGRDLNVTAATVRAALTPRTKCVIVAHLNGTVAPIDEIAQLLAAKGIALMDDAAQALGARCGGRLVGTFGVCGIVSCGPGKPLAGAAGGLLVTNDRTLYERAAAVALQTERAVLVAQRTLSFWLWRRCRRYTLPFSALLERLFGVRADSLHVNSTLSNLEAAIALAQLEALAQNAARRRRHASALVSQLAPLLHDHRSDFSTSAALVKLIYVLPENGPGLVEAVRMLAEAGIECQGGYTPLHREIGVTADVPATEAVWRRVLCVPVETRPGRSTSIRIRRLAATGVAPRRPVPVESGDTPT